MHSWSTICLDIVDHGTIQELNAAASLWNSEIKLSIERDGFIRQSKSAKVTWQSWKLENETHHWDWPNGIDRLGSEVLFYWAYYPLWVIESVTNIYALRYASVILYGKMCSYYCIIIYEKCALKHYVFSHVAATYSPNSQFNIILNLMLRRSTSSAVAACVRACLMLIPTF